MRLTILGTDLRLCILEFLPASDVLSYATVVPDVWCNSGIIPLLLAKLPAECRPLFYLGGEDETSGADTMWNVGPIDDDDKRMVAWRRAIRLFFSAMVGHPITPWWNPRSAKGCRFTIELSKCLFMFRLQGRHPGGEMETICGGLCSAPQLEWEACLYSNDETVVTRTREFVAGHYNAWLDTRDPPDMDLTMFGMSPTHGWIVPTVWTVTPLNRDSVGQYGGSDMDCIQLVLTSDVHKVFLASSFRYDRTGQDSDAFSGIFPNPFDPSRMHTPPASDAFGSMEIGPWAEDFCTLCSYLINGR